MLPSRLQAQQLQSGGGLLAAGTRLGEQHLALQIGASIWRRPLGRRDDRARRDGQFAVGASIWRRPLGRRDPAPSAANSIASSCFNLAAASWPPGRAGDVLGPDDLAASIWRRPLGRRDAHTGLRRVHDRLASIWRRPLGRRDVRADRGPGRQHGASIWRRPLGRRDARRQSSASSVRPRSFNLAAASWPPGP